MCICLNCQYINVCKQYNFIEKKHDESNINKNPPFLPSQSITRINILSINGQAEIEWDVIECLSFKEKPGKWLGFIK
uniref:Ycf34 n=1 Tax=Chattonella marina TaxID=90936 RepID=UPI002114718A|nr:Ycf34 [Chattonella marina]UTE94908.1 Ycf34 [Chattonella marina]